jgi:hypothetical protein
VLKNREEVSELRIVGPERKYIFSNDYKIKFVDGDEVTCCVFCDMDYNRYVYRPEIKVSQKSIKDEPRGGAADRNQGKFADKRVIFSPMNFLKILISKPLITRKLSTRRSPTVRFRATMAIGVILDPVEAAREEVGAVAVIGEAGAVAVIGEAGEVLCGRTISRDLQIATILGASMCQVKLGREVVLLGITKTCVGGTRICVEANRQWLQPALAGAGQA